MTHIQTGDCIRAILKVDEPITCASWHPDGRHLILGSLSQYGLTKWTLDGEKVTDFGKRDRFMDAVITPDGQYIVAATDKKIVMVISFELHDELSNIHLDDEVRSISITKDSRYASIGDCKGTVNLFDLNIKDIVKQFNGARAGEFAIRSSFAGPLDNMVISGSEGMYFL